MPPTLKPAVIYSHHELPEALQLLELFRQAPWAKDRSLDETKEMLQRTDLTICAWDGERLIGFGRVLTDFVYRATIWDVIVDRAYQGQGVGTEIVRQILHHPQLQRVELFWLCTRRPGFYERLGFSCKEQTGMVWSRSKNSQLE